MAWGQILDNVLRGLFGESFIFIGLAALGLNLHFGFTGLLNFGQAVFMAAGAYGLSMTVMTAGPLIPFWPENFWFGCFVGVIVFPVILAFIMGVPTLKLRSDYLAICTIAVAEMFRLLARSPTIDREGAEILSDAFGTTSRSADAAASELTGSSDGLSGFAVDFYALSPFEPQQRYFFGLFIGNQMFVVIVGWVVLALACLLTWMLIRSPWGRVLKAIREDEDAALSLGKNAYSYKMQALILGGIFGAMGGMLRAIGTQSAQPDNFITDITFFAWVALILGGAGKVLGPVIGAALVYGLLNFTDIFLRELIANGHISESIMDGTQVGQVRFMLIGLGLVLLAAFRPQGIFGNKEEMALDDR